MKASLSIRIFAGCVALAVLATMSVSAQFETSPDHYEFPGAEPFPQPRNVSKTRSTQYDASFTLPYPVECNGTSLPAGKYFVSLLTDGKVGQATLKGRGRALGFRGLVRQPDRGQKEDALIVALRGNMRRLAAIHITALDLVFDSTLLADNVPATESKRVDSVALIPANREK